MLYPYSDVRLIHLELTDKCNAGCAMCPRYINQGADLNPNVVQTEITLEQFKEWFPVDFVSKLHRVYACGNYGDPVMAKDCLEIFEYVREHNQGCSLTLHTNGSIRNEEWWSRLAKTMTTENQSNFCVFSIDGLADTNHLYRRGTDFDKIMKNAKAFINAGGAAKWDYIVFEHNQHQVEEAKELARQLGFHYFNIKKTTRWYTHDNGVGAHPVRAADNTILYWLKQPSIQEYCNENATALKGQDIKTATAVLSKPTIPIESVLPDSHFDNDTFKRAVSKEEVETRKVRFDNKFANKVVAEPENLSDIVLPDEDYLFNVVDPETSTMLQIDIRTLDIRCRSKSISNGGASSSNEIFVDAMGHVYPCCFLGGEPAKYARGKERSGDAFITMLDMAGGLESISLKQHTLRDIIDTNKIFTTYVPHNFENNQKLRSRQCASCCGEKWNVLDNGELGMNKKQPRI